MHLFGTHFPAELLLNNASFTQMNLAQIIAHPFVHVSWYHLVVDAGTFALLVYSLQEARTCKKLIFIFAAIIGSALLSTGDVHIKAFGLCGLSGAAHGLSAICALEYMREATTRKMGIITLFLILAKTVCEVWSGKMFFQFLHFGDIGNPIPFSHAGGVLGGIISYVIVAAGENFLNVHRLALDIYTKKYYTSTRTRLKQLLAREASESVRNRRVL